MFISRVLEDFTGDDRRELLIGGASVGGAPIVFGSASSGSIDVDSEDGFRNIIIDGTPDAIESVGDVDGDGIGDVFFSRSKSVIVRGRSSFDARLNVDTVLADDILLDVDFSADVVPLADINGDGFDDVLLRGIGGGADFTSLVYGASDRTVLASTPEDLPNGRFLQVCAEIPCLFSSMGDFDSDGYADLLVGLNKQFVDSSLSIIYGSADGIANANNIDDQYFSY